MANDKNATGNGTNGNGNGNPVGSGKMRTYQGFGYRFGNELHVSFDPIIGGWPIEFEVDEAVELREVTRHQAVVNGGAVKMSKLEELGLVKVAPGAQEAAQEAFKNARAEASLQSKAERAKATAEKAVARAKEMAAKAEQKALEAKKRAEIIANGGKPAKPATAPGKKTQAA